jgi:hypothetical protein
LVLGLMLAAIAAPGATAATAAQTADPVAPFLGRWDVTLRTPERAWSSWLEVERDGKGVKVRMVGRWGHARWLPSASIEGGHLRFVSPKEEEGRDTDMVFEAERSGEALVGRTTGPDGTVWTWQAVRAPSLARKSALRWGAPIRLFDGDDLEGWALIDGSKPSWRAADGALVSSGSGSDLRTSASFEDFKLHLEFNCAKGANSGVYLRGRYEVQIEDDPEPEGPTMRTGGVYGYLAPNPPAARTPGVWRSYDITLVGRRVTIVLDGRTVIKDAEIPGITGGALDSREGLPGPIMLQGSEAGQVAYRNIVLTPAKAR